MFMNEHLAGQKWRILSINLVKFNLYVFAFLPMKDRKEDDTKKPANHLGSQ